MPSRFVEHYVSPLTRFTPAQPPSSLQSSQVAGLPAESPAKKRLQSILVSLDGDVSLETIAEAARSLETQNYFPPSRNSFTLDEEVETLERAVTTRLIIVLYSVALDTLLEQASESEKEAEWWAHIERSKVRTTYYLIQSM
jgi:nuclear control of ATPase protein 2